MTARLRALIAATSVSTAVATAHADEPPPRDNTLSLPVVGFLQSSLGAQYERRVAPRFSFATSLALRKSGGEDFDVWETGFGVEGRYWLTRQRRTYLRGLYVGARFEYGTTYAENHGRPIGTMLRFGESAHLGFRWVFWDRFELTPSVGIGARTELDARGRLAPWTRAEVFRFGTTAGVVF